MMLSCDQHNQRIAETDQRYTDEYSKTCLETTVMRDHLS